MDLIKLKPIFKSRIWGGHRLNTPFHGGNSQEPIGEAWVVSAHPHGDCVIENGPYQGLTLSELYQNHRALFKNANAQEFPLLIKTIDAKQDLSVQVHPDDDYAMDTEQSLGKAECWLVLDCGPDAKIIIGHDFQSRADMQKAIETGTMQKHLTRIPIKPGDFFDIPAGTVHAICENTLIYEVQQSSDVTYRIDDYGRLDASGQPRPLHVSQALAVTRIPHHFDAVTPIITQTKAMTVTTFLDNPTFKIQKIECKEDTEIILEAPYAVIGCLDGHPLINQMALRPGDHVLALQEALTLTIQGSCTLMISTPGTALV